MGGWEGGLLDGRMGRRVILGGTYAESKRAWRISCSAGMSQRSSALANESKQYSNKAKDLHRQVGGLQRGDEGGMQEGGGTERDLHRQVGRRETWRRKKGPLGSQNGGGQEGQVGGGDGMEGAGGGRGRT